MEIEEITEILSHSKRARAFYRENHKMNDKELIENFKAIWLIEQKIKNVPILSESLNGYFDILNLEPIEILDRIKFKKDNEIRMDFEKLKLEYNKHGDKLNLDFVDKNTFKSKFEIKKEIVGDDFNNFNANPSDFSI